MSAMEVNEEKVWVSPFTDGKSSSQHAVSLRDFVKNLPLFLGCFAWWYLKYMWS